MTEDAIPQIGSYDMYTNGAYSSMMSPMYGGLDYTTNPMMSMYGLGSMNDPMASIYGGMNYTNPMASAYGAGYSMNNMFAMQEEMQKMQERMQAQSAEHNLKMHEIITNNDVAAKNQTFEQQCLNILRNSSNAHLLEALKTQINNGNSRGIVEAYKTLEMEINNTCDKLLKQSGENKNRALQIKHLIDSWYAQENGITFDEDVHQHCDNPFLVGFYNSLRPGNNDITAEEVVAACKSLNVKGRESKKTQESVGGLVGKGAGFLGTSLTGAAMVGTAGTLLGLASIPFTNIGIKTLDNNTKRLSYGYKNGLKHFAKIAKHSWRIALPAGIAIAAINLFAPESVQNLIWKVSPSS